MPKEGRGRVGGLGPGLGVPGDRLGAGGMLPVGGRVAHDMTIPWETDR